MRRREILLAAESGSAHVAMHAASTWESRMSIAAALAAYLTLNHPSTVAAVESGRALRMVIGLSMQGGVVQIGRAHV